MVNEAALVHLDEAYDEMEEALDEIRDETLWNELAKLQVRLNSLRERLGGPGEK